MHEKSKVMTEIQYQVAWMRQYQILGYCSTDYGILRCNIMQSSRSIRMLEKKLLPPYKEKTEPGITRFLKHIGIYLPDNTPSCYQTP